jgi:Domain of unknown function (DUF4397)
VKNLRWWSVVGAVAVVVALAGCSKSDSGSGNASVRVANATLTHPSIDFLINAAVVAAGTAADTVSAYASPSAGSNTLQINTAGSGTSLFVSTPSLGGGAHYTLVAYESAGTVKGVVIQEDVAIPASGATLRITDAAVEAGKLDIYIFADATTNTDLSSPCRALTTGPTTSFGALSAPQVVSTPEGAGTYRVCVTGGGSSTDLRLDMPGIVLATQQVMNLVLTPASGGQLVNGSLLIEQGAYSAVRNTSTRVRVAAAITGNATVGATASNGTDSYVITAPTVAPAFGTYALVPSTSTLNITAASASVGAPATALVAGADMTLLVYGPAGAPTASLLVDDNRPPADTTAVKLRLINGITGAVGQLSLNANSTPVANSVAGGTASTYASVTVNTANPITLTLLSSSSPGNYLTSQNSLNPNTSYTVMAVGDAAAPPPQLLIR